MLQHEIMLQNEKAQVSDQAVTRLALALYEAELEETRKREALARAAQEVGVPPHYLELAREQLRQRSIHPVQRPRSILAFLGAFIAIGTFLFSLLLAIKVSRSSEALEEATEVRAELQTPRDPLPSPAAPRPEVPQTGPNR